MSIKAFTVGLAALVWAVPAAAQERGTMEFGAFGSLASFDRDLSLTTAYGGGGRVGMFLDPGWSIEFEDAEMRASRPHGLKDVNVGLLSGRLVASPMKTGALSFLLGAGAGVSTETNFMHTYGVDALIGAKFALGDNAALRVDGVWDWLANEKWKSYRSVRLGLTLYRRPAREIRTVTVVTPAPALPPPPPVAMCQYNMNILPTDPACVAPVVAVVVDTAAITGPIHFDFDRSNIRPDAEAILQRELSWLNANPGMRIRIEGNADERGSDEYNLALAQRRATSVKEWLVDHGIAAGRFDLVSYGEERPACTEHNETCWQQNRRDDFRIVTIGSDNTVVPPQE